MAVISVVPGKFGSMAAYGRSPETARATMLVNSDRWLINKIKEWINYYGDAVNTVYIDEYYMLNSYRLDKSRIDITNYAYTIGKTSGIAAALVDFVVPVDTRELLLTDRNIVPSYDVGPLTEDLAYKVASKAFPGLKKEFDDTGDMFIHASPSIAILSKVVNGRLFDPSFSDTLNTFRDVNTNIFC